MNSEQVPVSPPSEDAQPAQLERRIAELQSKLEHEQHNREAADTRLEQLQSESEAQAIVVAGLEDQLLAARRGRDEAETRSHELEERLRSASQERDREKAQRAKLQADIVGLNLETISGEALLAERNELKRQLADASGRVDQLQQYCNRLKSEREQAQKHEIEGRGGSKGGSSVLSTRLIEARDQISGLEAEVAALQSARDTLEQQLREQQQQTESVRLLAEQQQADSQGREDQLQQELHRLQEEMSEGAFAAMTQRQESLENTLRERDAELALRSKELDQAGRERRRLEDLLNDKGKAVEQLEQQVTKLTEKLQRSEGRREEAARELAHTEATYRAVQAQLEQRFTQTTKDQGAVVNKGPWRLAAAGVAGLVVGALGLLSGQGLGIFSEPSGVTEGMQALVNRPRARDEQVPPPTDSTPTESPVAAIPAATPPETAPMAPIATPTTAEAALSPPVASQPPPRTAAPPQTLRDQITDGGPALVGVPGGSFRMGYDRDVLAPEETPAHPVQVPPVYIGRDEVTFAEYDRFARATGRPLPSDQGWGRGQRPVINVSWNDAQAYTAWMSGLTGKRYRLPSEAEWEYAARAGTESFFWWGNILDSNLANCFDCGSQWDNRSTAPVGSFAANPFGLRDTAGNVMEWVADCYHDSYEGAPADGSAWTSGSCNARVARGGAFSKPSAAMHASRRSSFAPDTRLGFIGFRVVREP